MKSLLIDQLKKSYSLYVRQVSKIAAKQEVKQEIVYLLSFPNNDHGLIESLSQEYPVTVCYTKDRLQEAEKLQQFGVKIIPIDTFQGLLQTVETITESKILIADNYFPLLADIHKRKNQFFFQIWHATGAIKQFGLEDKATKKRSLSDQKRFKRVYDSFDYYVVGSEKMGDVFKRSYGASEDQMLYLGFPRTDYLVNQRSQEKQNSEIKKIVYLPTYRDNSTEVDLLYMVNLMNQLGEGYELFIKTHPHVTPMTEVVNQTNIHLVDPLSSADELLLEADILITDYSSVAFDYALLNPLGKLIFYWYDEEAYMKQPGLQPNIKETLPNQVCQTITDVTKQINSDDTNLAFFNQSWNIYNDGSATRRLIQIIKEKMD